MERPRFFGRQRTEKESIPSTIQIVDNWNPENPELPFFVDPVKLTALAVRDLGFIPTDIARIKFTIDSDWGVKVNPKKRLAEISIGAPNIYASGLDAKEAAKNAQLMQEKLMELLPITIFTREIPKEAFDNTTQSSVFAANALIHALAICKATFDQSRQKTQLMKRSSRAATTSAFFAVNGYSSVKYGYDFVGVVATALALGSAGISGNSLEKLKNLPSNPDGLNSLVDDSMPKEVNLDEWKDVFSFKKQT